MPVGHSFVHMTDQIRAVLFPPAFLTFPLPITCPLPPSLPPSLPLLPPPQKGALSPLEVCEALGLQQLRNRYWHIQGTCAPKGEGLYEGLDWLSTTLKTMQAKGQPTSVSTPGP